MTMDKHLLHSTDHDASEDAPSTAEENSHESSYHSANGERARREASTESEHSTSSVTKSESCWAAEPTSSVSAATPSPGAILLLDDLFIAQTLHKISPLNFSDPWLSSVRAKYLASFLTTSSTTRAAETKTELLTLVAFNPDSNAHLAANIAIRDRTLYLSNICEILAAIGQYQRHREQQLRGDSGTEKGSGHSSAGNSSSSADVDLLLKDIRSYILTTSTASTGGESAKATATEINTTTGQTPSGGSDDLQHVHQNGDSSGSLSGASRRRHSSSCSSPLLGSILVRLTKLLHGCIESDATRYDFYQIFANAIHSSTLAGSSDSYRNLNNLVNSLANFDLNSSQIMLGANAAGPGASSVKPQANTSSTATAGGSEREHTPPSSSSSSSMARKDSLFASSGTTHFYQSVADCCEELSTSGGSSSSSGYGRSTTSNCSGIGGGTAAPPLFRDILLAKPANLATVSSSSTSPGTIGSGASAASTREPHSSGDSLGSPLSSTFLNSQLAAVAAELCDLNDLPKLIPPTETAQPDLYGSPFDMRLPAFTGRAQHGILERPEAPLNFFTINAVSPPNASSNQCFTISMDPESAKSKFDSNHGAASLLDKRTAVEVASACLSDSYSQPNGTIPPASLIERDLFYRLIISQLLYHGHRSIANQLASAERIKADGSLLSPSDRLHILVSMAFRSEINKISVNPTPEMTPYSRPAASSAPYQLMDPSPNEQTASGLAGRSMLEDGTGYSKNLYERSQSHLGHSTYSSLFNSANGHGKVTADEMTDAVDYGDVPIDHLPDVGVYRASPELYFASNGPSRSSTMGSTGSGGLLKQMSHPPSHLDTSSLSNRSQSNNSLRSGPMEIGTPGSTPVKSPPSLASTMLDLNAPSGSGGNGGVGFVLNENAMKNLNQLASKLNDVANVTANGAAAAVGPGPIFGRSASAMASMNSGSSSIATSVASVMAVHQMVAHGTTSAAYHGQLSRSPVPGALNGTKSPLGLAAANGPSHTTGNGKNHKIMQIRSKFGSLGAQTNQFSSPHGFCLGINEEIVIADTNNHRICVYEKNGTFKHSFGNAGKDEGQLWYPRKITMICSANVRGTLQNPYYVICDRGMERSRMQIFTRAGNFVRKIPIRYIDIVAGIAVNAYGQIVTVDSVSPTIFIISETGDLVEWFDCSDHMREPSDIAIYKKEYYICDFKGHCVVVFNERGKCLRKIGIENLTSFPNGIDISANGDILVGDSHGNRFHVAIFNQEGKLLTEYECPYVKVSRCCGLKLTSEGYVVTLAKNNHHVLVLNTLFIGP